MARYVKKKPEHPMMGAWLKQIGEEVSRLRKVAQGKQKQESFKLNLGVSRSTLSAIENGSRSYGLESLLRALAGISDDPVAQLLKIEFPTKDPAHTELHRQLQDLLKSPKSDATIEVVTALHARLPHKTTSERPPYVDIVDALDQKMSIADPIAAGPSPPARKFRHDSPPEESPHRSNRKGLK